MSASAAQGWAAKHRQAGRDIGFASATHEADDEIAQGGHRLRAAATAHLGTILVVGHIPHPIRFVLDGPVLPDQVEWPGHVDARGDRLVMP